MTRSKLRSGLSLFRQALLGSSTINYTEGSIARATFLLAVPMILEMSMESVFAIVDIFFVASLGAEAVATVGLTESVISLLYAVAIGLSMGTTAMVSRRIGEEDPAAAAQAAGQALWIGVVVSLLVGVGGIVFAEDILRLLKRLQNERGLAYMFITHDLATVRAIADHVVVMQNGEVMEQGSRDQMFTPPHHPYTKLLLSSVAEMDPDWLDHTLEQRKKAQTDVDN